MLSLKVIWAFWVVFKFLDSLDRHGKVDLMSALNFPLSIASSEDWENRQKIYIIDY